MCLVFVDDKLKTSLRTLIIISRVTATYYFLTCNTQGYGAMTFQVELKWNKKEVHRERARVPADSFLYVHHVSRSTDSCPLADCDTLNIFPIFVVHSTQYVTRRRPLA